jgi:hypothetical protein
VTSRGNSIQDLSTALPDFYTTLHNFELPIQHLPKESQFFSFERNPRVKISLVNRPETIASINRPNTP